ncbi:MAG TPA: hypothetical protein VFY92_02435, partial [Hyphomicrobiaceae bacterium]|nr:hypothetical protein [Hyphomicrobiaceae bacterium]
MAGTKQRRLNGKAAQRVDRATGSLAQLLQAALQRHGAGDLAGAAGFYEQILRLHPRHPDALHLLGVACLQT